MAKDLRWALFRSAAYLRGRGVTFGSPLVPSEAINSKIYSITVGLVKGPGVVGLDEDFSIFADSSLDHVLITPMVAAANDPQRLIRELVGKLKVGGHLILLTSVGENRPGVMELYPHIVEGWAAEAGKFLRKLLHEEDGKALQIYKRIQGKRGVVDYSPQTGKRVCICRYGALGDAIILTPLLRKLREDGYHVTLNVNPYCLPALENNPYINNLIVQEKDVIPNQMLGEYWRFWETQYERYHNLSESIEGDLLMVEPRPSFFTSKEWRHSVANVNYYDHTMVRGGYSGATGQKGELFFTKAEERRAAEFFGRLKDKFIAIWALNGSSHHKVYPMMEPTLNVWFERHPDSVVITVGDVMAQLLEFPHPQLLAKAGQWSVRESLIATKYADLVIGPETMITNAAGCFPTPKITLLSHSTHENLCKYWENDYCLAPTEAACYPCHQLHYTRESCPTGVMKDTVTGEELGQAPLCTMGVAPTALLERMQTIYEKWATPRVAVA